MTRCLLTNCLSTHSQSRVYPHENTHVLVSVQPSGVICRRDLDCAEEPEYAMCDFEEATAFEVAEIATEAARNTIAASDAKSA
jgi:hypothetical protein